MIYSILLFLLILPGTGSGITLLMEVPRTLVSFSMPLAGTATMPPMMTGPCYCN
jgi:hypothetical protein